MRSFFLFLAGVLGLLCVSDNAQAFFPRRTVIVNQPAVVTPFGGVGFVQTNSVFAAQPVFGFNSFGFANTFGVPVGAATVRFNNGATVTTFGAPTVIQQRGFFGRRLVVFP